MYAKVKGRDRFGVRGMASDLPLGFTRASKYETFKAFCSSEGLFELLVGLAPQITGAGAQLGARALDQSVKEPE